jgi:cytochrome c oxidase cbb3-type subunit II
MSLSERPVLFAVAAAAVVSVGTLVTTFIPLFMPATQPTSPFVTPYDPIETEGRDVYIREGCNNCHTQTVRPLRTEVARYGEYSKPEESAYDRPFLWGSRRTGPDLARIGGRYPDSWHYRHMADPRSMFAASNMPAYAWLATRPLDTSLTARKVRVLGYGYGDRDVADRIDAFRRAVAAADSPFAEVRSRMTSDALRGEITELDALVAYLQKVGRDLKELSEREAARTPSPAAGASNPFAGSREALVEGKEIFRTACAVCHGEKGRGGIGPSLSGAKTYGGTDADLFASISGGRAGGMPSFEGALGEEKIWKVITYIRNLEKT